jgi:hypothetical protein
VSVSTLYDLTIGKIGWPVRLTAHSHPSLATLTLRNLTPGGPVLDIIDYQGNTVLHLTEQGFQEVNVGGWIDLAYQGSMANPPANTLRLYSRGGSLYYRVPGADEQRLLFGPSEGSNWGWSYWMSGG